LSEDLTLAARDLLLQVIDWIVKTKGRSREQAYALAIFANTQDEQLQTLAKALAA
jgi:formamidase